MYLFRGLFYFPGGSEVKASACNAGDLSLIPGLGRSPVEGNGNPLQYSCLKNPMDRGAWWSRVRKESDTTERLHNGNPLQYSCLENPRDGGAQWAAIYGVAQSRTQLSDFTYWVLASPS